MIHPPASDPSNPRPDISRRQWFGGALAAASAPWLASLPAFAAESEPPKQFARKIKLGVIGNGGRGGWIAKLFQKHGGYDMFAVADYFQEVADKCGDALGVDKGRRFSGLSGHKKLFECGVEAVALETPPFFLQQHAPAAVAAGLHVYMAKPVAADVPGALAVEAAGKLATQKRRVFMVDYQMPTDPVNLEVVQRIRDGGLGKLAQVQTVGMTSGFADPPRTATIEDRLQHLIWVNDIALGCDYIGNFDIHAIDAALWVIGRRPVAAMGVSQITRDNPHGDAHDVCSVVYEYDGGLVHNHFGQALRNNSDGALTAIFQGTVANAQVNYWNKAFLRGGPKHYGGGKVENLYQAGAERNIATFYRNVTEGRFDNPTLRRSVDGVLACILGREAAARRTRLTMEELLKENKRLDVSLAGLKA
jgi:myo-inositol 2-dehydrogenase / D-chiro-inositol 1-dehydrogenase